jgi:hypothetical protein
MRFSRLFSSLSYNVPNFYVGARRSKIFGKGQTECCSIFSAASNRGGSKNLSLIPQKKFQFLKIHFIFKNIILHTAGYAPFTLFSNPSRKATNLNCITCDPIVTKKCGKGANRIVADRIPVQPGPVADRIPVQPGPVAKCGLYFYLGKHSSFKG